MAAIRPTATEVAAVVPPITAARGGGDSAQAGGDATRQPCDRCKNSCRNPCIRRSCRLQCTAVRPREPAPAVVERVAALLHASVHGLRPREPAPAVVER